MGRFVGLILLCGLLFSCLHSRNANDRGLNRGTKTIHAIILLLLVLNLVGAFRIILWAAMYPDLIFKYSYVLPGYLPPWLAWSHDILCYICELVEIFLVFGLAKRQSRARERFIKLIPLFFIVTALGFLKGAILGSSEAQRHLSINKFWVLVLLSFVLMGMFYVVIYRFYASEKTKRLLFGPESSGSNPEQPVAVDSESQADGTASTESSASHDD